MGYPERFIVVGGEKYIFGVFLWLNFLQWEYFFVFTIEGTILKVSFKMRVELLLQQRGKIIHKFALTEICTPMFWVSPKEGEGETKPWVLLHCWAARTESLGSMSSSTLRGSVSVWAEQKKSPNGRDALDNATNDRIWMDQAQRLEGDEAQPWEHTGVNQIFVFTVKNTHFCKGLSNASNTKDKWFRFMTFCAQM